MRHILLSIRQQERMLSRGIKESRRMQDFSRYKPNRNIPHIDGSLLSFCFLMRLSRSEGACVDPALLVEPTLRVESVMGAVPRDEGDRTDLRMLELSGFIGIT